MPANYAFYSTETELPIDLLAWEPIPDVSYTERGLTFTYSWPDLSIVVSQMPDEELEEHLRGFEGWIRNGIYGGGRFPERVFAILDRLRATKMVLGFEVEPDFDKQGRASALGGTLLARLHPLCFHHSAIFDEFDRLLLAPDKSFEVDLGAPPPDGFAD